METVSVSSVMVKLLKSVQATVRHCQVKEEVREVVEKVVEGLSFEAPERAGERVRIDAAYVHAALEDLVRDEDLSRYIL